MRRLLLAITLAVLPSAAVAQYPYNTYNYRPYSYRPYSIQPDYSGGLRYYDLRRGVTTRFRPDYSGGYRYQSSDGGYGTIRPDYSGGWRTNSWK